MLARMPALKWVLFCLGLLLFCLGVTGCSVNAQFVDAVDDAWTVIEPRYVDYVQTDTTLDEESKATRIRTAEILSATILEAKK